MFVDRRVGKSKMGSHIVTEAMLVVLGLRFRRCRRSRSSGGGQSRGGEVLQDALSAAVGERVERGVVAQQRGVVGIRQEQVFHQRAGLGPRRLKKWPYGLPASRSDFAPRSSERSRPRRQRGDDVLLQRCGQGPVGRGRRRGRARD